MAETNTKPNAPAIYLSVPSVCVLIKGIVSVNYLLLQSGVIHLAKVDLTEINPLHFDGLRTGTDYIMHKDGTTHVWPGKPMERSATNYRKIKVSLYFNDIIGDLDDFMEGLIPKRDEDVAPDLQPKSEDAARSGSNDATASDGKQSVPDAGYSQVRLGYNQLEPVLYTFLTGNRGVIISIELQLFDAVLTFDKNRTYEVSNDQGAKPRNQAQGGSERESTSAPP